MQLLQHHAVISTTEPFHCLDSVRAKGWMKGRHDAVVQLMEKFIKKRFQDATVTNEPAIQTRLEVHVQLRADLLVGLPPQIGRHFIINVTVSNPAAPTFRAPPSDPMKFPKPQTSAEIKTRMPTTTSSPSPISPSSRRSGTLHSMWKPLVDDWVPPPASS